MKVIVFSPQEAHDLTFVCCEFLFDKSGASNPSWGIWMRAQAGGADHPFYISFSFCHMVVISFSP